MLYHYRIDIMTPCDSLRGGKLRQKIYFLVKSTYHLTINRGVYDIYLYVIIKILDTPVINMITILSQYYHMGVCDIYLYVILKILDTPVKSHKNYR